GLRAEMDRQGALAVVTPAGRHLLRPRPERFREVRDLDSSRLDAALEAVPGATVEYQHDAGVALQAVAAGTAGAAVLLRPATIDQIEEIARGGQRMPPKTTFFDPKPSTGAVFRVFELEDRPA